MAELMARTPCAGLLPLVVGSVSVTEVEVDAITSVAPLRGQEEAVSDALHAQIGARFPKPNRTTGKAQARAVWSGRSQALVLGPPLDPIAGAAMTDQTDAWACVDIEGAGARDALARLVPLDLRPDSFKRGHAARSLLGHLPLVLMRTGTDRYGLMTYRSMAETLVHDLKTAMAAVAARG